jgi:hypothetical protein
MDASAMKTLADVKMENIGYNSDRSDQGPQLRMTKGGGGLRDGKTMGAGRPWPQLSWAGVERQYR